MKLLNLDFESFDQSLPSGGWRKYQSCPRFVGEVLDAYTSRHFNMLQKWQWDLLVWHSGQSSALAEDYNDAILKMEKTMKPDEKPSDDFLWNPYARGTIAFLKKDKPALVRERKLLARGSGPLNHQNLKILDSFIRCFESTYKVAYSGSCEP